MLLPLYYFGINEFYAVDVHAPIILNECSCKAINIDPMKLLADYIKSLGAKDIVVVAPDKGAIERSRAFANHFGVNVPVEVFEKERDVKTGEIKMSGSLNLNDKEVVIADDIIANYIVAQLIIEIFNPKPATKSKRVW